jgi:hypothetical protein
MASRHLSTKHLLLLANWLRDNVEMLKTEYAPAVAKAAEAALGFPISDRSIHSIAEAEGFILRRHIEIERAAAKTKPEPQLFDGAALERLDRLERLTVRIAHHLNLQHLIKETNQ